MIGYPILVSWIKLLDKYIFEMCNYVAEEQCPGRGDHRGGVGVDVRGQLPRAGGAVCHHRSCSIHRC